MSKLYFCNKCGKAYPFWNGIGFAFPRVYAETIEKIKSGEYGETWRNLFEEHPNGAVNITNRVYYCSKCGDWHQDQCLDFYIPKNEAKSKTNALPPTATSTDGLDEETSLSTMFVTSWNLDNNYVLHKKFPHKCNSCGNTRLRTLNLDPTGLERATSLSGIMLRCPECGGTIKKSIREIYID